MNDWIFYREGRSGIYKMRTDGSEKALVVDEYTSCVNTLDGWIYYQASIITGPNSFSMGGPLYKMKPDGSSKIMLCESSAQFDFHDGWIYYIDGTIKKMRTDGSEKTQVCDIYAGEFVIEEDWIYFNRYGDGYKLYKVKTDGSNITRIFDMDAIELIIADNWIYFINAEKASLEGALYKMKTDGTDLTKIYEGPCKNFNIINSWIYFRKTYDYTQHYRMKVDGTFVEKLQ